MFVLTALFNVTSLFFPSPNLFAEEVVNLAAPDLKASEEAINLSAPIQTPTPTSTPKPNPKSSAGTKAAAPTSGRPASSYSRPTTSETSPYSFKVYFDLNLVYRPGIPAPASELTFDNYHAFLFFEGTPMPGIQFNFEVVGLRFYELDWQITPNLQFRAGKIWIPFDDTTPHNIYGGRVNVSAINTGTAVFLPDLWTELGVGLKWNVLDVKNLNLVADAYIVNGMSDGGSDPVNTSGKYPSFSGNSTADNNLDKAVGGRIHGLFFNRHGLGLAAYSNRWTDQSDFAKRYLILGADYQFKMTSLTDLRLGIASMKVDLPNDTMNRAGTYAEFAQYLSHSRAWRLILRGGTLQLDDRVIDKNDQRIVGATLTWRPNVIMFSIEHSRDIQKFSGKSNYSFTNLRMVVMF